MSRCSRVNRSQLVCLARCELPPAKTSVPSAPSADSLSPTAQRLVRILRCIEALGPVKAEINEVGPDLDQLASLYDARRNSIPIQPYHASARIAPTANAIVRSGSAPVRLLITATK